MRALALAERAGHTETATLAHQHLTHHLLANGSPAEAVSHAARGLALAPPLAAPRRVVLRTLYGQALAATGRTGEAVRQLGDALREARAHAYMEGEKAAHSALAALDVLTVRQGTGAGRGVGTTPGPGSSRGYPPYCSDSRGDLGGAGVMTYPS
ncbi:hypothetical protein [Streptomyces goshikiensis]|uniref:hypothetical protein n=1 Tax=Streptomyces goshikiensis TaxID=1942 RepID=UPI003333CE67